jgi:uncharacterized damage-inducible protein DinB
MKGDAMIELLNDFYGHQAWADAEHWNALESHSGALSDEHIWKRLYHIHMVQRSFLQIVRGKPLAIRRLEEFIRPDLLKEYAVSNHEEAALFLKDCSEEKLLETLTIPWFKDPPIRITIAYAMIQAAMHSHSHRAQNATRLRELGGKPPLTDFILWLWKERPDARWTPVH